MTCDTKDILEVFDKMGAKATHKNALIAEVRGEFNVLEAEAANALIEALQLSLLVIDRSGFLRKP